MLRTKASLAVDLLAPRVTSGINQVNDFDLCLTVAPGDAQVTGDLAAEGDSSISGGHLVASERRAAGILSQLLEDASELRFKLLVLPHEFLYLRAKQGKGRRVSTRCGRWVAQYSVFEALCQLIDGHALHLAASGGFVRFV